MAWLHLLPLSVGLAELINPGLPSEEQILQQETGWCLVRVEFGLMSFAMLYTAYRLDLFFKLGAVEVVVWCYDVSNIALYLVVLFAIPMLIALVQ